MGLKLWGLRFGAFGFGFEGLDLGRGDFGLGLRAQGLGLAFAMPIALLEFRASGLGFDDLMAKV